MARKNMENEDQETEDGMLRWIAGVMGFELHHESEYNHSGMYEADRWWFMSKPFPRGYTDKPCPGWRMTMSFYTQGELLSDILKSRTAFIDGCNILRNPFCGMSRDEIMLRMTVAGA